MDYIETWIKEKTKYIDELLMQHKGRRKGKINSVFCNKSKGRKYFLKREWTHGREKKTYLGKAGSPEVVHEKYDQMTGILRNTLQYDKKLMQDFANNYIPFDIPSIEGMTSKCLHGIQTDFVIDRRMEKLFEWANEPVERNGAEFGDKVIMTKDGTRARSKDECILYDLFDDMNIPNRYDCMMEFDDPWNPGEIIKKAPDFVIPTISGKLILVEHAGLILKPRYAENLKEKIQLYLYNGYVLGDNFFITSGDKDGGINERALQRLVAEISDRILNW